MLRSRVSATKGSSAIQFRIRYCFISKVISQVNNALSRLFSQANPEASKQEQDDSGNDSNSGPSTAVIAGAAVAGVAALAAVTGAGAILIRKLTSSPQVNPNTPNNSPPQNEPDSDRRFHELLSATPRCGSGTAPAGTSVC